MKIKAKWHLVVEWEDEEEFEEFEFRPISDMTREKIGQAIINAEHTLFGEIEEEIKEE
jgi:hypothetical protein